MPEPATMLHDAIVPRAADARRWIVIVGGGLLQVPLVHEARALGLATLVTDRSPACPCASLADCFLPLDVFDVGRHVELVLALRQRGVDVAGVLVAGIDATVTGAVAARAVGLPGVDPVAASTCKHKPAMRELFARKGIPVPRWAEVASAGEAERAIARVGFPCIVKNTDSSASRGTRKFFSRPARPGELHDAVEKAIAVSRSRTALIEELWAGPEQTVETLFDVQGRFHPCFITSRIFAADGPWALETGLEHPADVDRETETALYATVRQAAEVLGIEIGAAKADTMLTRDGPRIIEMTTRLSGGFDCQLLVPAATGKNVLRAALMTAIGAALDPADLQDRRGRVAVSGSPWPAPGRIRAIRGIDEARAIPGVEDVILRCAVGDEVSGYEDCAARVCFVIASGATRAEARATLRRALATVEVETCPVH